MIIRFIIGVLSIFSLLGCGAENATTLTIDNRRIELGVFRSEVPQSFQICVSNPTNGIISILGVSESCSCVSDSLELPIVIAPYKSTCIQFHYLSKSNKGYFNESIFLSTNTDSVLQRIIVKGVVE
jgi:hypothetical protein